MRLTGSAGLAENPAGSQTKGHGLPFGRDLRSAMHTGGQCRHQTKLPKTGQLKPEQAPSTKRRVVEVAKRHHGRIEETGMRVVVVG